MAKRYTVNINRFDGGISEDKRVQAANKYSITKHFDALTYPHKLVPFTKTQATDSENKTFNIVKFIYANSKLYGLGDVSGNPTRVQIYENGGLGSTDNWTTSTNGAGSTANKNTDVFFAYAVGATTYIYTLVNGDRVSKFDTSGGAFTDNERAVTYTTTQIQAQPILHPSDNIAYFFADNVVHVNNAGSWSTGLTLPATQRIVSACAHGNYLALGCITLGTYDIRSTVYLWDRDSSLTTLSERVDFGEGTLKHLFSLDNNLIGVVDFYSTPPLGNGDSKVGRVHIKQASGQTAVILSSLTTDATGITGVISNTKFVRDNIAYFPMAVRLNGDQRSGIWALKGNGLLTLAIIEEELSTVNGTIQGIYATANIWWIAHSADGSVNRSSYTNSDYSSTNASTYESLIFTGGDSSQTKKLVGVTVMTEPLVTSDQVVLKYRKDEETSWTTIFTTTTANSISHDAVNIESSGANLPQFNEIQFQILSTSGAVITGLRFDYEEIEDGLY